MWTTELSEVDECPSWSPAYAEGSTQSQSSIHVSAFAANESGCGAFNTRILARRPIWLGLDVMSERCALYDRQLST